MNSKATTKALNQAGAKITLASESIWSKKQQGICPVSQCEGEAVKDNWNGYCQDHA
jgi:hypothetical protein